MSHEISENQIWERQDDESQKAYDAFCTYRDMGKDRSLLSSYRLHSGKKEAKQFSGQFSVWYERYEWKDRARAYDIYLEKERRKQRETLYQQKLDKFAKQIEDLASVQLGAAINTLKIVTERLKTLKAEELDERSLPAYIRAASHASEVATNAQSQLLGIEELMQSLKDEDEQS